MIMEFHFLPDGLQVWESPPNYFFPLPGNLFQEADKEPPGKKGIDLGLESPILRKIFLQVNLLVGQCLAKVDKALVSEWYCTKRVSIMTHRHM